ncbi:MAG: methylenetetrahydrofolate reductase C-terminal domain-containing protein [Chloroflexota bacterium]
MTSFPESLARADGLTTLVELVPWAGPLQHDAAERHMDTASALAADPRITAITITDNAGGHIRLGPLTLGRAIRDLGSDVVVHLSCRDRSRASLESVAFGLASEGLTNVLALSGDYPREGYGGLSQPVFDIDSVGLLSLLQHVSEDGPAFTAGAAVNPFKALEADLVPQLLKLAMKARAGASFAIAQVGWDVRSWHELLRWTRSQEIRIPLIAAVYILGKGVANIFHRNAVPGIRLSDRLMALVEHESAGQDKGRARFLEMAAMQVAVARGLGFAGVYLAGQRNAAELDEVLTMADGYGADDWRDMAGAVSFPERDPSRLFEAGDSPHFASDRPAPRQKAGRASLAYRIDRLVHDLVFEPGSSGAAIGRRAYERIESARLARPAHVLEQVVKIPLFSCRDCGDCSLPDIAYLCPESRCAKNQRNGPCGGSIDGQCEVPGMPCIWTTAYDRLKPHGEELTMLEREPVLQDHALRGSSAWGNSFLGRDHSQRGPGHGRSARHDRGEHT